MRKGDMERGYSNNRVIYRRNLQRPYCKGMEYLMKEEIKSTRSADYYNVAQSE
jgi:hypothetical protein